MPRTPFASLQRALALCAPGAAAALVVALMAPSGVLSGVGASGMMAIGVACGVLAGAAVSSLMVERVLETEAEASLPPPPAPEPAIAPEAAEPSGPQPAQSSLGGGAEVLKRLPSCIILVDAEGRTVFANDLSDLGVAAMRIGEHFTVSLRAPGLIDAVDQALTAGAATSVVFSRRRAQERHFSAFVGPVPEGAGDVRAMIVVTEETQTRRAEQLHRDFVANASHELKTPLASITGFIETLQNSARSDPAVHERFLGIMAAQAERMKRLVEDLLSLNRIELKEHVAPREQVDLAAVLEAAVAATLESAPDTGVVAAPAPPASGAATMVRGDANELSQVFINLIENAYKYGANRRAPVIRFVERADRRGVIGVSVEDHGPGIAKEHLPRLTERFYRVDDAVSRNSGGTGLGLAIVKHVVSRHRGELTVDSALGRGSVFTVWLPIQGEAGAAAPTPDTTDAPIPAPAPDALLNGHAPALRD